jgi:hypothetical protein
MSIIANIYYLVETVAGILTIIATTLSMRRELRRSRRYRNEVVVWV